MQNAIKGTKLNSSRNLAVIGMLSAIAYILMFISIPLPIFPSFLKIDLSDIPSTFGGMALGPMAGPIIVVVKNLLQAITATTTGGCGELANIMIGGAYVLTICLFYKKSKSYKSIVIGSLVGILAMTIMGCIMNYFIMLPLYSKLFMPMDVIIGMGAAINPRVTDLMSFIVWMIAPFNIVKAAIMTVVSLPLVKKMEKVICR